MRLVPLAETGSSPIIIRMGSDTAEPEEAAVFRNPQAKPAPSPRVDGQTDILAFDRASYPRFYDGERVAKYCVPIQGDYHAKLFPEISFAKPLPLFSGAGLPRERTATAHKERTPGNTIRKVYLCRAQARGLRPGDILLFYMSQDDLLEASQSITTIGIVEQWRESRTLEELMLTTARRSVFSQDELARLHKARSTPVKVIVFLLVGHLATPVGLKQLLELAIFNGRPPQSIAELGERRYQRLRAHLNLGFQP